MAALLATGENRFIHARIAQVGIQQALEKADKFSRDLEGLTNNLAEKVSNECGKVVKERDQLRRENRKLTSRINRVKKEMRDQVEQAQLEMEEIRERYSLRGFEALPHELIRNFTVPDWREAGTMIAILLFLLVLIAAASVTLFFGRPGGGEGIFAEFQLFDIFVFSSMIIPVPLLVFLLTLTVKKNRRAFYMRRQYEEHEALGMSSKSSLVYEFIDITRPMPLVLREELAYLLQTEIANMPPGVGERYIGHFLSRFGGPKEIGDSRKLEYWIEQFLLLDRSERRIVAEQIRRVTLV